MFLLLWSFSKNIKSQELHSITLSRSIDTSLENSGLMPTFRLKMGSQFRVDQKHKNYIIKEFYFQPLRYFYQHLKEGHIDQNRYDFYKRRYGDSGEYRCLDSAYKIQILVCLDSYNNKTVVFDINRNQDFTDDSVYTFEEKSGNPTSRQSMKTLPIIMVPVTYCLSKSNYVTDTVFLRPYPYTSAYKYSDEIENKYYLMIQNATSRKGLLKFRGDEYEVKVLTAMPLPVYNLPDTKIYISRLDEEKKDKPYYELKDRIKLAHGIIQLSTMSKFGDSVFFEEKSSNIYFDPWKNIGLNFKAVDFDGRLRTVQFNKKLTLLDFWGSWCKPCIALLPSLKTLHKNLRQKGFTVVSIAYDEVKNLNMLKKIVTEEKLSWVNLFEDITNHDKSSLINKYKISAFPTYILVDHKGMVIIRGEGEEGLNEIASFAKKFLL